MTRCRRSANDITLRGWLCLAPSFGTISAPTVTSTCSWKFQASHVPGFHFVAIEREFSGLLHGRRVDMVTPKFLNPRIRDQILSSAESLFTNGQ